ncbi:DUF4112 domain-containing protein [Mariniblastus fucicola]|uniref:DUF4112 domain-containing protein n=1 Tax=Mariniblastus fucicola TaxID=980251 RepID=A0A5B9PI46_9BACT|nr:DUF4112 domain-containing protein [Mariniblastus fucicola]QEG24945.1 hypothetical protein MFFC18_48680 [Mariniblastus fucicola]
MSTNSQPAKTTFDQVKDGFRRAFPKSRRGTVSPFERIPRIRTIAHWMDGAFRIPGTQRRIGLDSLVGLVPGIGDLATTAVSAFIIREAWLLGIPKRKLLKMSGNVAIDAIVGAVPLVGDLFDFAFKSNSKNVAIVEDHFGINSDTIEGHVVRPDEQTT